MTQKHPVNNRDLYIEVKLSRGLGKLTARAATLFQVLAKNMMRKMQYEDEDDKLDCLQTALLMLFSNWHNFNDEKYDNAFAYFTECAKRGLAQGFNEIHQKRGLDKGDYRRSMSINSANGGQGMFNV